MDDRPHCRIEIETYPSRVFVRLNFANGNGDLRAGVLTLEPKIWLALRASLEGWCIVEVEAARDSMVWHPSVVEELLTGGDDEERGSGHVPDGESTNASGEAEEQPRSNLSGPPHPDDPEPVDPDDDDIIAIDDDDPFQFDDEGDEDEQQT